MAQERTQIQPRVTRTRQELQRRDPFDTLWSSPFAMMRRFQDEFDRLFGSPGASRNWAASPDEQLDWAPAVDVFQRGSELVVRADIPGISKEDLEVEVNEDSITVRGERRYEKDEEREGVYRSERSYGTFARVVPLPEGTITDSAKATFKDGVLEIVMEAPGREVKRGRRIEIGEGKSTSSQASGQTSKK
jgi:HSP20 family protein